jgi:hypothetical protein
VRFRSKLLLFSLSAVATMQLAIAEGEGMKAPTSVEAGKSFSIELPGSGSATLYIVGTGHVLKRVVQLGHAANFPAGSLYNAGHYLAVLAQDSSTETASFDVVPAITPTDLAFIAKPSRIPVGLPGGITGAVYVFDAYHNLIATPTSVTFELSNPSGGMQKQIVNTRNGTAWTVMNSTAQQGVDSFVARVGQVSSMRIIGQVPGDPCSLKMNAQNSGHQVLLTTDPVRDCNDNAVPDGTIVTFTATFNGIQSTIDQPLKRGIAEVKMSTHNGMKFSVASGIVMGNQIRWEK